MIAFLTIFLAWLVPCLVVGAVVWRFGLYIPPFAFTERWHWTDRVANFIWRLPPEHQR